MSEQHTIRFEKRKDKPIFRCNCTCGYYDIDTDLELLQARAGTHDIPWEPLSIKPEAGKS